MEQPWREPPSPAYNTLPPSVALRRVHFLIVIAPIFPLASPSSRHLIVVVFPVRPSRTHRRLHPIRYHVPLLACKLLPMFQGTRAPKIHYYIGERLRDLYSSFGASGCTLVCAKAVDVVNGRARLARVGGGNVFVVGLWREWLGRAHLSGMYPRLFFL